MDAAMDRIRRVTLVWMITALVLFPAMTLLGYLIRRFQASPTPAAHPEWFYSLLTLHALGMVGTWFVSSMAGVSYLLSRYVRPSPAVSLGAFFGTLAGVVLVCLATVGGFFGAGWYFLFPLPLYPNGAWPAWATALFFGALALLGTSWLVWALDVLRAISQRYSLSAALCLHYLGASTEPEVPPIVLITTVSLIVCISGLVSAVIVLVLFAAHWAGWLNVDALLMKNLTFLFGHTLVNISLYLGLGIVYEVLPGYAGRPWKTNRIVAMAWSSILFLVLFAYFHHLYMDFAQPGWVQTLGQIASYFLSLPAAAVTIFGVLNLIYGASMRWTPASTLFVLGVLGWAIGGVAAVIDATVAVNFVFHNTLWVPAHFHTYFLAGLVFFVLGFIDHLGRELSPGEEPKGLSKFTVALLVVGAYGFVATFYWSGASSVPRRFATYPDEVVRGAAHARTSLVFIHVFLLGMILYLWMAGRRCVRALFS